MFGGVGKLAAGLRNGFRGLRKLVAGLRDGFYENLSVLQVCSRLPVKIRGAKKVGTSFRQPNLDKNLFVSAKNTSVDWLCQRDKTFLKAR